MRLSCKQVIDEWKMQDAKEMLARLYTCQAVSFEDMKRQKKFHKGIFGLG